ncbi:hypothetical protein D3C72_2103130 [compost metagenome]
MRPRPSREKITSISRDPAKNTLIKAWGMPATTNRIALRNTWPYNTRRSLNPLARAVMTYWRVISLRKAFLVSRVMVAKPPITKAPTGSTRCQK